MNSRLLSGVLVLALATTAASQQAVENPYAKAKVGDYLAYKMSTEAKGKAIEMTMKQVVAAKDEKSVTLKVNVAIMGNELPAQEQVIDVTKPLDITGLAGKKGKFEKTGEGSETITVGGKSYDCKWTKGKFTATGKAGAGDVKVWTSSKVPMSGMVKMEIKSMFADVTLELTAAGSSK